MKKQVFLLLAALVFSQAAFAYDFSAVAPSGQTLYYNILSGSSSAEVCCPSYNYSYPYWDGYIEPTGNLVIPDSVTYNGTTYQVTCIGNYSFYGCSGLISVTIPNSVTNIGVYVFRDCSGLTSLVVASGNTMYDSRNNCNAIIETSSNSLIYGCLTTIIPNTVTSIGSHAFSGCSGLTSVSIPNSVTSIGAGAFYDCSGLISVSIPNSVTSIRMSTFYNCSGLTSVTIGNSVTSISYEAFYGCSGLTAVHYNGTIGQWCEISFDNSGGSNPLAYAHHLYIDNAEVTSASIPNTVTEIKPYAFCGCSGLTSVTIPNSVTSIGNFAFSDCSGLNYITIGNSVTSIGNYAFNGCSGLISVNIPNSITSIGNYSFYRCSGLASVTIPNSVTSIGNSTFSYCNGLTSVTIGNSVTSIGGGAFSDCSGLISITFLGSTPPQQIGTNAFGGVPTDIPVYIPCGRLAYYVNQLPLFTNYIERLYEFSAASADESMGTVQVLTEPSCTNPNAVLNAVPANGYRFDHWSTGSTTNPYTLTVTSDTTVIGYFVSDGGGTEGIGEVEGATDMHISVSNGHINVEGVAEEEVRVYDIMGRAVQNRSLPSGVYMVRVGTSPAQKIVVMR